MYRRIINLLQKKILCIKLVNYQAYTEMHGQQNIVILLCVAVYGKARNCSDMLTDFLGRQ